MPQGKAHAEIWRSIRPSVGKLRIGVVGWKYQSHPVQLTVDAEFSVKQKISYIAFSGKYLKLGIIVQ